MGCLIASVLFVLAILATGTPFSGVLTATAIVIGLLSLVQLTSESGTDDERDPWGAPFDDGF